MHGIVAGIVMVMFEAMHPRMDSPSGPAGNDVVRATADGVRLTAPGLFAKNYGAMTPAGLVVGHLAYGLVVALVYAGLT